MLLQPTVDPCSVDKTTLHHDEVFKDIIKSLTPDTIYTMNQELLNALGDTLVNYSPISINITDYWNKDTSDHILVPLTRDETLTEQTEVVDPDLPCFSVEDGETDPEISGGFGSGYFGPCYANVEILDLTFEQADCGFHINSIVGVQDKLAEIFLNNFYAVVTKTKGDTSLRRQITNLFKKINIDTDTQTLFTNITKLFNEEKYASNREFAERKGTTTAMKYAGYAGWDAGIQGIAQKSPYYMDIETLAPLSYSVESTLLPELFNTFVKPLAHPIGFNSEYKMVCTTDHTTEYVFSTVSYSATSITVASLCASNMPPVPVPVGETIDCGIDNEYEDIYFVFATADGTGLDSILVDDEDTGNILVDIENGVMDDGDYVGWVYNKYILQNDNYVIKYQNFSNTNTANEIVIEYYRSTGVDTWELAGLFSAERHSDLIIEGLTTNIDSTISDILSVECVNEAVEWFSFDNGGAGTAGLGVGMLTDGTY